MGKVNAIACQIVVDAEFPAVSSSGGVSRYIPTRECVVCVAVGMFLQSFLKEVRSSGATGDGVGVFRPIGMGVSDSSSSSYQVTFRFCELNFREFVVLIIAGEYRVFSTRS